MIVISIAIALIGRLFTLGLYPLTDPTEGRYADIGRRIVETGDWITPWIDSGIPFWGKPPLSFWLTGSSLQLLGESAFAARLPHFLAGLLTLWIIFDLFKRQSMSKVGLYAIALTTGSVIFYLSSGTVMTDATLGVGCALAMRGFWLSVNGNPEKRKREWYLFFIGLAIGLLAKGPLVLVLCTVPIVLWALYAGRVKEIVSQMPLIRGILLMLLISLPWYVLAEIQTPGFIEYFIIGEHWQRYLQKDWSGDLYGRGHGKPLGMIWVYAFVGMLPWTLILPFLAWSTRDKNRKSPSTNRLHMMIYFGLWGLLPLVFFSVSKNILISYTLPAIPPLACLAALWLEEKSTAHNILRPLSFGVLLTMTVSIGAVAYINLSDSNERLSTEALIKNYSINSHSGEPLYFFQTIPYSAKFYTTGQAKLFSDIDQIREATMSNQSIYIALDDKQIPMLPQDLTLHFENPHQFGRYTLFQIN